MIRIEPIRMSFSDLTEELTHLRTHQLAGIASKQIQSDAFFQEERDILNEIFSFFFVLWMESSPELSLERKSLRSNCILN